MEVSEGSPCFSSVVEMGDASLKTIYGLRDKYETAGGGTGTVTLYIRGSADWFTRDDAVLTWEEYTAPISRSWRYMQWKIVFVS